jgi:hypothetical protein
MCMIFPQNKYKMVCGSGVECIHHLIALNITASLVNVFIVLRFGFGLCG